MVRELTADDLRSQTEEIVRALEDGESFLVVRNGIAVGQLSPVARRTFVPAEEAIRIFAGTPHVDYERFRRDLDEYVDQDPAPRA